MQPIHSGTTTERLVRALLLVILMNGFAIWYLWDGYAGYPRANARALIELLGLQGDPAPVINWELTEQSANRIISDLEDRATGADVESRLGEPALQHGSNTYYLGRGGHLRVSMNGNRVAEMLWGQGRYSESEQRSQRGIGYVLGVIGLAAIGHLLGVLVTRVSLTDEGLKIGRRPMIPLDAITGLAIPDRARGAAVVVEYVIDGRPGSAPLDAYIVKEQPAIIAAIRERKGFPDSAGSSRTTQDRGQDA